MTEAMSTAVPSSGSIQAFGVLAVGDIEVAIPATVLQEVVGWPERMARQVLSPDYILGTFSLRGLAVPAVDLRRLLDLATAGPEGGRIVVLQTGEGWLGLAVDATADVVRVPPDCIHHLTCLATPDEPPLVTSLLIEPGSGRIIQILDVAKLVARPGVRLLAGHAASALQRRDGGLLRQLLFFACDGLHFCLDGHAVREVIATPGLEETCSLGEVYRGLLRLRGEAIPVIDLFTILGLPGRDTGKNRLLVLDVGGCRVAVLASDVVAIQRLPAAQVLPVPRLGLDRPDLFAGVIAHELSGREDALLLDHEAIMRDPAIAVLQRLLDGLGEAGQPQETRSAVGTRTAFLGFQAGASHTVALGQVQEIMPMPTRYLGIGSPDGIVLGLVKRRGTVVSLISFRRLAGLPDRDPDRDTRILVVRGTRMMFALVVDATRAEEHVFVRETLATGEIPAIDAGGVIRAATGLLVVDGAGGQRVMAVLDLAVLAAQLELAEAALV